MATKLENKINRVASNVSAALTAIASKGVTVPAGADSEDLASLIAQIITGGGGEDLSAELTEQETIIANLERAIAGKAAGNGGQEDTQPNIQPLTITKNGIYTASGDVDGYSPITVNIQTSSENDEIDDFVSGLCEQFSNTRITAIREYAFGMYENLRSVYLPNATNVSSRAFYYCTNLTTVNMPAATTIGEYAFQSCESLMILDFKKVNNIGTGAFASCVKLESLILRTSSRCSVTSIVAFNSTPIAKGTGYIYVPASLVDSYKSAATWRNYAEQIRAIEDYPSITGGTV